MLSRQAVSRSCPVSVVRAGALLLPPLITSIDNTLMYVGLPAAARALGSSPAETLLIANTYSVVLAGFLITGGAIADRLGRRRVLLASVLCFGAASLWAGLATDSWDMILARADMGVAAGVLGPATLALLRDSYPQADAQARMVAVWSSTFAVGAAVGPVLGGWFVSLGHWRWAFWINVPVCVAFVLVHRLLPSGRHPEAPRVRAAAAVLLPLSVLCLSSGVLAFGIHSGLIAGAVLVAAGGLTGWWFVAGQLHAERPTVNLRLLGESRFRSAVIANFLDIFTLGGLVIVLSEYVQWGRGGSALTLVVSAIPAVVICIGAGLGAGWMPRHLREAWWMIPLGLLLSASGCAVLAVVLPAGGWTGLALSFCLVGAGLGITETLTNTDVVAGGDVERAGSSSAISETAYELGSAFGVLILGLVAQWGYRSSVLGAGLAPSVRSGAADSFLSARRLAAQTPGLSRTILDAARNGLTVGTVRAAALGAVILVLAAVVVALHRIRHSPRSFGGV
jgi:DHA2 family multidrug resistance protein-like MFS transporter